MDIAQSRKNRDRMWKTIIYSFLFLGAISMAIPYIWMFVTSIKPIEEIQSYPPSFVVKNPTALPYQDLFRLIPMWRYILNSVYVASSVTLANLFFCSLAGYAFAKHRFLGRDKIFFLLLGSLMIPWQVNIISGFVLMKKLGWLNSYNALIVPAMAGVFGVFLCRQFIMSIPDDLIDAAKIDGCSEFMIYRLVILPLIKPVLATLAIFTFLQQWNNFIWPLIVINSSSMRTLPLALSVLNGQFGTNFAMVMAGAVVATTPMLIVFLSFQKYFMRGITLTGLKGWRMKKILMGIFLIAFAISGTSCAAKNEAQTAAPEEPVAAAEKAEAPQVPAQEAKSAETQAAAPAAEEPQAPTSASDLAYLKVEKATASGFDESPDWAPKPDPMAPVDGSMDTRWSSAYNESEWIYFDFSKPKTLSKIIIKWEQAYPTAYEILTSDDGTTWKRLILMENQAGGTSEINFEPVTAQYVKVLSVKRASEEWGISMWEFEPYGPKDKNPGEAAKEVAFVQKRELTPTEKKVMELKFEPGQVVPSPGPITPAEFQRGVTYTSWSKDELAAQVSDMSLAYLADLNVGEIALMVVRYQETAVAKSIYIDEVKTISDETLGHAINVMHALGMKVMLKPHVDCADEDARVNILPSDEWFKGYKEMMVHYAELAAKYNVELYCVGTELSNTTTSQWKKQWTEVIDAIKAVYKGPLTYAANWDEYETVSFWEMVDYIGMDAYFPLTNQKNPPKEDLVAGWERHANTIEAWRTAQKLDKPVIFTEVGYDTIEGSNIQPWRVLPTLATHKESQDEQANCLAALFEAMAKRPWFKGFYWWNYFPRPDIGSLGYTLRGKKGEKILAEWFGKLK